MTVNHSIVSFCTLTTEIAKLLTELSGEDLAELANQVTLSYTFEYEGADCFIDIDLPSEEFDFSDVCDLINRQLSNYTGEDLAAFYHQLQDKNVVTCLEYSIYLQFRINELLAWAEHEVAFTLIEEGEGANKLFGYSYNGIDTPCNFASSALAMANAYIETLNTGIVRAS